MRIHWLIISLALGCASRATPARSPGEDPYASFAPGMLPPDPEPDPEPGPEPDSRNVQSRSTPRTNVALSPPGETLYALDEALADAVSGPLVLVGTGNWFGMSSEITACAYRNDRVFVVNVYCTAKEMPSFELVVLSPTRGRAYIYAEAKTAISNLKRASYFTFQGEAQPALVDAKLPALQLAFTFSQLRAWDEKRYKRYVPGCFGGVEMNHAQGDCVPALAAQTESWAQRNKAFFATPPADWYRIIRELRARAAADSKS